MGFWEGCFQPSLVTSARTICIAPGRRLGAQTRCSARLASLSASLTKRSLEPLRASHHCEHLRLCSIRRLRLLDAIVCSCVERGDTNRITIPVRTNQRDQRMTQSVGSDFADRLCQRRTPRGIVGYEDHIRRRPYEVPETRHQVLGFIHISAWPEVRKNLPNGGNAGGRAS